MSRRTKIICTIGPATADVEKLVELIQNGMEIARLNFSHGTHLEHEERIRKIKEASRLLHKRVGILVDTRGPEIRIKAF
ncbi:MAG TPA: pyruvate kinase, partial [Candidatus Kapabacteria bacterium]|nr:pyruvate kinase [Candidatus Kapabacteria bacterium]